MPEIHHSLEKDRTFKVLIGQADCLSHSHHVEVPVISAEVPVISDDNWLDTQTGPGLWDLAHLLLNACKAANTQELQLAALVGFVVQTD